MKISEFARRCGISVRMLRFYESAGILVPARTPSGYREYDERDIGFVRAGQDAEIKVETFSFQKYGTLEGCVKSVNISWTPSAAIRTRRFGRGEETAAAVIS